MRLIKREDSDVDGKACLNEDQNHLQYDPS